MTENYYASHKSQLLKDFDRASSWFKPHLIECEGKTSADILLQQVRNEYELLIPQIPFIGGSKVHMTEDLMESVQVLAYLRVLKAHGKTIDESKETIYGAMKTRLTQYPHLVIQLAGMRAFSRLFLGYLQRQAQESQKRKYPDGFVFEFVRGDHKEFDWGLDIVECGICKFYHAQGASEFLPMVCSIDYVLSDALGYGLVRTQTLAEGADKCNPRLKKGRPTQWRVPSEA